MNIGTAWKTVLPCLAWIAFSSAASADTLTWVGGDGTVRFVYAGPPPGLMFIFK